MCHVLWLSVFLPQSKNVEEKAVWDQQSYNQTHEPVWASKEVKQQSSSKSNHTPRGVYVISNPLMCFAEQRYNYGKSSSSSTQGSSRSGHSGSGSTTKPPGKSSAGGGPTRPVAPPPPATVGGQGRGSGPPMERQYTGQFSMFVDEGQFPTWDD